MKLNFKTSLWIFFAFALIYSGRLFRPGMTDFRAYYLAGNRIISKTIGVDFKDQTGFTKKKVTGVNDSLYQVGDQLRFKYTPVIAYLFVPFSIFPYQVGKVLYYAFSIFLFLLSLYLIYYHFKGEYFKDDKKSFWFFMAMILLTIRPILTELKFLNVNFLILFLTVGFLFWKDRRENLSSLMLSLLIGIKIFPIFLLLFLFLEKDYRFLGKTLLWGLFLIAVPVISYGGFGELWSEYINYASFMTNGQHAFPAPASYTHPNLDSFIVRVFMDRPYFLEMKTNIFSLDAKLVFNIINFIKLFFLGSLVYIQRSLGKLVKDENRDLYYWGMVGLYSIFFIVINPLAWKHAMISLLIPFAVVGLWWMKNEGFKKEEKIMMGLVISFLFLTSHLIWGNLHRTFFGRIGHDFWGMIFLGVLLYIVSKKSLKSTNFLK